MSLVIEHLQCGYGTKNVVQDFSVSVEPGEILCILGPNGVGKTTLFNTILGNLPRQGGRIFLDGREMNTMSRKEQARWISYVPQAHNSPFAFSVLDVVLMGRIAYLDFFASPKEEDMDAAWQALDSLGIAHLADQIFTEISGGEKQMVLIARALAQQPRFLMMDEPTSNLDFGNQAKVLKNIRKLADLGLGVIMTTHDPDQVFQCDANVVLMMRDKQILTGPAEAVVTQEHMLKAYEVPVWIAQVPIQNKRIKICQPVLEAGSDDQQEEIEYEEKCSSNRSMDDGGRLYDDSLRTVGQYQYHSGSCGG